MHQLSPRVRLLTRPWARRCVVALALLVCAMLLFGFPGLQSFIPYRIDLDVYRIGAATLLRGGDLYGTLPSTQAGISLPFTYPPVAAVLFVPLALMPSWAANLALTGATLLAVLLVQRQVLRAVTLDPREAHVLLPFAFLLALLLGPVQETIGYGQINALLMALVLVDVLAGRNRWWRGWLVGLAMAVKLTPAVFLAYFLVRRDGRALLGAAGSAVLWTGLGFVVTPTESLRYWTSIITDPGRIGGLAYVSNQSLNGALVRLADGESVTLVWFALCAGIGLASLFVMRRLFAAGEDPSAMLIMAVYALLASPVSWSHHWVWVAPALVVLLDRWRRSRGIRFLITSAAGAAIFCTRIIWAMPHESDRELGWSWWQHILGNAQTLWGLALMAVLATGLRRASGTAGGRSLREQVTASDPRPR